MPRNKWFAIAFFLVGTAAFGQTVSTETPCQTLLHPDPGGPVLDRSAVLRLLADAQEQLDALPASARPERREAVLDLFRVVTVRSGGSLYALYNYGAVLQIAGQLRLSRHVFQCIRGADNFYTDPGIRTLRGRIDTVIVTLSADIANQEVGNPPPHDPVVVPPVQPPLVGRLIPPVVRPVTRPVVVPPVVALGPHPRSPSLRTAGQVGVGVSAALAITGVVLEALCLGHADDIRVANENPNRFTAAEVDAYNATYDAGQALCTAGPVALGSALALGVTSGILWGYGGATVSDTLPPPRAPLGLTVFPRSGGGGVRLTWHF